MEKILINRKRMKYLFSNKKWKGYIIQYNIIEDNTIE